MSSSSFTAAQRLKFGLFAHGVTISPSACEVLRDANGGRELTPADYASTSGVILLLNDDVWVNAPISTYNANFVQTSPFTLDHGDDGFFVHGSGLASPAKFWLPPRYHGTTGADGTPLNNYVFTHGDRVRLAPVGGCSMVCTFCNIPYEDRYRTKPIDAMIAAVRVALGDPLQAAQHILISGGTPSRRDVGYLREVYERILTEFHGVSTDIMMAPIEHLFNLQQLDKLGLNEISINIEIFNRKIAAEMMRQKYRQGLDYYLGFLDEAAQVMGGRRVRSMLMVGLEPMSDTLDGVRAIVRRGCVPVLSPFRPDPATPLRSTKPLDARGLEQTYLRAAEIALEGGVTLGPDCPPCSHNTLTFVSPGAQPAAYPHPRPTMI